MRVVSPFVQADRTTDYNVSRMFSNMFKQEPTGLERGWFGNRPH